MEIRMSRSIIKEAIDRNVAHVIGSAFFPNGGGHKTLRLNFSFLERLAGLLKSRIRGAL